MPFLSVLIRAISTNHYVTHARLSPISADDYCDSVDHKLEIS